MWLPALTALFRKRSIIVFCARRNLLSTSQAIGKDNEYNAVVYKFPYIRAAGIVNRSKLFQSAASATAATVGFALSTNGIITESVFYSILCFGIAINVPLYTLGYFCNNVIGFIYLSQDHKTIKIAYLNFWGRRKEEMIEVEDIVPFMDMAENPSHVYFTIERISQPCYLKMSLRYGKIQDNELFTKVFGELGK